MKNDDLENDKNEKTVTSANNNSANMNMQTPSSQKKELPSRYFKPGTDPGSADL